MSLCTVCGAPRDPIELQCKYCKTAFTSDGSVVGGSYIEALRNILAKIDQEASSKGSTRNAADFFFSVMKGSPVRSPALQAKLSAISTFAMPADTENLLQFFMFCHGNASIDIGWGDHAGEIEKEAWTGKARMAFGQLNLLSGANSEVGKRIQGYENLYGLTANKKLPPKVLVGLVVAISFILLGTIIFRSFDNINKTETLRIQNSISKTQQLFLEKKYDAALMESSNITWRNDNSHSDEKNRKLYDRQREELIAHISNARQEQIRSLPQTDSAQPTQAQSTLPGEIKEILGEVAEGLGK